MKYLFFDIECANCFNGKGKICSFGYCIVDEEFNVIEIKDLIINPKDKFNLGPKGDERIHLAYSKEVFESSPDFLHYFEEIKNLFTQEDTIVFGHAVSNDISFLKSEFERYNLNPIDIKAYDTQVIYKQYKKDQNPSALDKLCVLYNIPVENLHRSDYDASLTMQLLKAICKETNNSIASLLEEYPNTYVEYKNNNISKSFEEMTNSKRLQSLSHSKIDRYKQRNIRYQKYSFDSEIEDNDYNLAKAYVRILAENDAIYLSKVSKCCYYICRNKVSKKSQEAFRRLNRIKEEGLKQSFYIISEEKFKEHFKIDDEKIKDYLEDKTR